MELGASGLARIVELALVAEPLGSPNTGLGTDPFPCSTLTGLIAMAGYRKNSVSQNVLKHDREELTCDEGVT